MKTFYYSQYGPFFEEYLALIRSFGYKCSDAEYAFRNFDRFTIKEEETSIGLSKEFCDKWIAKALNEIGKSCYNRRQIIRGFSSYLQALNHTSCLPKLPKIKITHTPYTYTNKGIAELSKQCDMLQAQATCYNSI